MLGSLLSAGHVNGLGRCTTDDRFVVVAVDHGASLTEAIAAARGAAFSNDDVSAFKQSVVTAVGPHASAVIVDLPHLAGVRVPDGCGLIGSFEDDGTGRHAQVARVAAHKVDALKYYVPITAAEPSQPSLEEAAEIVDAAHQHGLDVVIEPLLDDTTSIGWQQTAIETADLYSSLGADLLKLDIPTSVDAADGDGMRLAAPGRPFVYLGGGSELAPLLRALEAAGAAGVPYHGVMIGRTIWRGGIAEFGRGGTEGLNQWLDATAIPRVVALAEVVASTAIPLRS